MWISTTLRAVCPRTMTRYGQSSLVALGLLLLSGCGGGGSSSTDEGFRFVPDGSGAVIPFDQGRADAVHFEYDLGAVSSGVVVTVAPLTAVPSAPIGDMPSGVLPITSAPGQPSHPAAYQVNFTNAPSAHFSSQPRLYLAYDVPAPAYSTPRIYIYNPNSAAPSKWSALPISMVAPPTPPTAAANTVLLEVLLPADISTGSIVAIFADTPPPPTGVPVTVTGP